MNKLEFYSSINKLNIDKPSIYDVFFPIDNDNFILLDTECSENKYKNWQLVVGILNTHLQKLKVSIFHNGGPDGPNIISTNRLSGTVVPNQLSYLIKKSKLLITVDPLAAQMAALFNKDFIFLGEESLFKKYKFLWLKSKNYKIILKDQNTKPEDIASEILKFFDVSLDLGFETVYIGKKNYDGCEFIENVPNQVCRFENMNQHLTVRMDLFFSEDFLIRQFDYFSCAIVTNKRINLEILKSFKHKISQLVYIIEENDDPEFCESAIKLGLKVSLFSKLEGEEVRKKKFYYMEMGLIYGKEVPSISSIKNFDNVDFEKLYFLSNRFILSDSKVYPSEASFLEKKPTSSKTQINPIINNQLFWDDLDTFWILKKKP